MNEFYIFLIYSVALFLIMLISQFLYKFFRVNSEWTRKFAHLGSGIIALTYPFYIHNHWLVFALSLSFTIILFFSKKSGFFKSIFNVGRTSYGDLFFVWTTWLLFWLYQYEEKSIYYFLPFSIVVFSDTFAAIFGKYFPLKKLYFFGSQKSIGGSLIFFTITLVLSYYFFNDFLQIENVFIYSLLHAMILTLTEALSVKGWDNITIPVISVIMIYIMC
jgi:dolichol kinase